jgi:hypothetical protein
MIYELVEKNMRNPDYVRVIRSLESYINPIIMDGGMPSPENTDLFISVSELIKKHRNGNDNYDLVRWSAGSTPLINNPDHTQRWYINFLIRNSDGSTDFYWFTELLNIENLDHTVEMSYFQNLKDLSLVKPFGTAELSAKLANLKSTMTEETREYSNVRTKNVES